MNIILPKSYTALQLSSKTIGFSMGSKQPEGELLKALITAKPKGHFLELGTGMGLSLSWMVDGMDKESKLISIDNDQNLLNEVIPHFKDDHRVSILHEDASKWLQNYTDEGFDLVFADAWPGKFSDLSKTLSLVNPGGIYMVDDLLPQSNWPEGHQKKVNDFLTFMESQPQFITTQLTLSTGVLLAVKKPLSH
ncbi:MAG: class I SAM-dependent methyltransferase [Flavobacteriaceae bacterium]|nr:class I SAM-dependent methyltransferase [Flavobacteriaceae bacterium]